MGDFKKSGGGILAMGEIILKWGEGVDAPLRTMQLWTYFTFYSSVSFVNFEHVTNHKITQITQPLQTSK